MRNKAGGLSLGKVVSAIAGQHTAASFYRSSARVSQGVRSLSSLHSGHRPNGGGLRGLAHAETAGRACRRTAGQARGTRRRSHRTTFTAHAAPTAPRWKKIKGFTFFFFFPDDGGPAGDRDGRLSPRETHIWHQKPRAGESTKTWKPVFLRKKKKKKFFFR